MPGNVSNRDGFQHRLLLGAIPYTITIDVHGTSYRAKWFCGGCSNHSRDILQSASPEAVLAMARESLAAHQAEFHSGKGHLRTA